VFAAVRATPVAGVPVTCNQAIVTLYESGTDGIGWHSDKMASIVDPSIILDVSLGGERRLCIRESEDGPVTRIPMPHGSAVAFDTNFNKRYQQVPGGARGVLRGEAGQHRRHHDRRAAPDASPAARVRRALGVAGAGS
jgi:alkylated DNA repair dioxygenase AlkB